MNDSANKIQNGGFMPRKRRASLLLSMLVGVMTLFDGSLAYATRTFFVNSTRDAVDANPGDGICQTTNTKECALRAAIMELNALSISSPEDVGNVVLLSGVTYTLTIKGPNEDDGRTGDLDIRKPMTITSGSLFAGPAIVRGSSDWDDRIFHINATSNIVSIEIQNGHTDGLGGGILIERSPLSITNSTVSANFSLTRWGHRHHAELLTGSRIEHRQRKHRRN